MAPLAAFSVAWHLSGDCMPLVSPVGFFLAFSSSGTTDLSLLGSRLLHHLTPLMAQQFLVWELTSSETSSLTSTTELDPMSYAAVTLCTSLLTLWGLCSFETLRGSPCWARSPVGWPESRVLSGAWQYLIWEGFKNLIEMHIVILFSMILCECWLLWWSLKNWNIYF